MDSIIAFSLSAKNVFYKLAVSVATDEIFRLPSSELTNSIHRQTFVPINFSNLLYLSLRRFELEHEKVITKKCLSHSHINL